MCLWGASREVRGLKPPLPAYGQHHAIAWGPDGVKEEGLKEEASLLSWPPSFSSPTSYCLPSS